VIAAPTVAVLLTELIKLVLSVGLEIGRWGGLGSGSDCRQLWKATIGSPMDTLRVSVPALLYTVQNNLIYIALAQLEVVVFQVLYQAKLLLTAVLSVYLLKRRVGFMQWAALMLLTVGVIFVELSLSTGTATSGRGHGHGHGKQRGADARDGSSLASAAVLGAGAALGAAALSALAGVYFEAVIKAREANAPSLWVRNVQLCISAIPLAALGVAIAPPQGRFLGGFDLPMKMLVFINGAGGLVTAAVIKYGDNILKNFATAASVVLGTVVSVYVFDFRPGLQAAA
jgi:UDP-sugar transporter A1/2/3